MIQARINRMRVVAGERYAYASLFETYRWAARYGWGDNARNVIMETMTTGTDSVCVWLVVMNTIRKMYWQNRYFRWSDRVLTLIGTADFRRLGLMGAVRKAVNRVGRNGDALLDQAQDLGRTLLIRTSATAVVGCTSIYG